MHCKTHRPFAKCTTLHRAINSASKGALPGHTSRPRPQKSLHCAAAAPSSSSDGGGRPSSGLTPADRIKQAILGYPSAAETEAAASRDQSGTATSPGSPGSPTSSTTTSAQSGTDATEAHLEPGTWEWWYAYFNSMDDAVRELESVDEELRTAIEEEDYAKAAALRAHQARLERADCVGAVLEDMDTALEEERYGDAATLRDAGGAGMLGWWIGSTEGDPYGHLLHVSPDFGRYVGHAYSGINIGELLGWTDEALTAEFGPSVDTATQPEDNGTPVFELFVRKDADGTFHQQAAALHAPGGDITQQDVMGQLSTLLANEVGSGGSVSVERGKGEDGVGFVRINIKGVGDKDTDKDGQNTNDRVEGNVGDDNDDGKEDSSDIIDALKAAAFGANGSSSVVVTNDAEDDADDDRINSIDDLLSLFEPGAEVVVEGGEIPDDVVDALGGANAANQVWMEVDGELKQVELEDAVAGAMSQSNNNNSTDDASPTPPSSLSRNDDDDQIVQGKDINLDTLSSMGIAVVAKRVPAEIEWRNRDAFTLVVAEDEDEEDTTDDDEEERVPDSQPQNETATENTTFSAAFSASVTSNEGSSDESVETVMDAMRNAAESAAVYSSSNEDEESDTDGADPENRGIPAFSGNLDEIENLVRTALGNAIAEGGGDGPNGPTGRIEYTRLPSNDTPTDVFAGIYLGSFGPHGPEVLRVARAMVDGEEWVHATKLTGDSNVPAGKLSFRARVGREHRLSSHGVYPPEYGVVHRYKGQGRVAREGYTAAKWVEGELLTFSAANPVMRGAELGFVFDMDSSRKYLLLFTKVKLDELIRQPGMHMY